MQKCKTLFDQEIDIVEFMKQFRQVKAGTRGNQRLVNSSMDRLTVVDSEDEPPYEKDAFGNRRPSRLNQIHTLQQSIEMSGETSAARRAALAAREETTLGNFDLYRALSHRRSNRRHTLNGDDQIITSRNPSALSIGNLPSEVASP